MLGINHMVCVDMKIKGMVGIFRIMRMAAQGLGPADDLAHIFNNDFPFGQVLHGKDAFTMHAGAARLNATCILAVD